MMVKLFDIFLISSHYRSPLNFSSTNIDSAKSALKRLYTATRGLSDNVSINYVSNNNLDYEDRFNSALNDDFNTPIAISILFEIAKQINVERLNDLKKANALSQLLKKLANFLGILEYDADEYLKQGSELSENEILDKISTKRTSKIIKRFCYVRSSSR